MDVNSIQPGIHIVFVHFYTLVGPEWPILIGYVRSQWSGVGGGQIEKTGGIINGFSYTICTYNMWIGDDCRIVLWIKVLFYHYVILFWSSCFFIHIISIIHGQSNSHPQSPPFPIIPTLHPPLQNSFSWDSILMFFTQSLQIFYNVKNGNLYESENSQKISGG